MNHVRINIKDAKGKDICFRRNGEWVRCEWMIAANGWGVPRYGFAKDQTLSTFLGDDIFIETTDPVPLTFAEAMARFAEGLPVEFSQDVGRSWYVMSGSVSVKTYIHDYIFRAPAVCPRVTATISFPKSEEDTVKEKLAAMGVEVEG